MDFLRRLFRGRRDTPNDPVEHREHVLLSARVKEPMAPPPGFAEAYRCTTCREYFVLEWKPTTFAAKTVTVVSAATLPEPRAEMDSLDVFCPQCRRAYPEYGAVLWPRTSPLRMTPRRIIEIELPPGERSGAPSFAGFTTERIVVLVSGVFPPELQQADFAVSFLVDVLGDEFALAYQGASMEIILCLVDNVYDETVALFPLLQRIYPRESWENRLFVTRGGPQPLRSPLGEVLLCLIPPAR